MTTLTFDKLAYTETLKNSGVPEVQARAHAMALDDALRDTVATRRDLDDLKRDLEHRFETLESRLTIKMGAIAVALGGFLSVVKFFGH